jgi:pre-rRNA-processing protein TSR4
MPQFQLDSDSDSDSDHPHSRETSVLLGIPDGAVSSTTDLADAAVSRIGGRPVRSPYI